MAPPSATDRDRDALDAVLKFHESRLGVRGLVESGVATVPPLFLAHVSSAAGNFAVPSVDLSLPRAHAAALVRAAASSCGVFEVTNHGVPAGTVESALSEVRAFNEQPFAARSQLYSVTPIGSVTYTTTAIPRPSDDGVSPGATTPPLMPWRDSLIVGFDHPTTGDPDLRILPPACRESLLEYHRSCTRLGKEIAGMLSEGLGVETERLEPVQGHLMQCHYHPPCPEPERVLGSREHTDLSLFTVLAQDGVGGLQVRRLDDGEWVDVTPTAGALLVNIGDVLKVTHT
jgi:isopenicillin N synthase-like dioxygenase